MASLKLFTASSVTAVVSWYFYKNFGLIAEENCLGVDENLELQRPARVAVIGTGIGGASASFFLRRTFGSSLIIDAFEKSDKIGGRMRVIDYNGSEVEAGGTIIHDSNKYMVEFVKHLGLEQHKALDDGLLGIYDGKEFVFTESKFSLLTNLKLIWRYGITSLYYMSHSLNKMLDEFGNIYSIQNNYEAFETVQDLLRAQGGETFVNYTQRTAKDVMKENGMSDLLIDELATGITRCNYGQDTGVNAFTGYVSLAGSGGSLWSVKDGNYLVCDKLFKTSNINVLYNKKVKNVRKESNGYYIDTVEGKHSDVKYDAVIVAAPLEVPNCYFKCKKCSSWPKADKQKHYQQTIATFIQANLNFKYFDCKDAENCPKSILTTESKEVKFSSVGPIRTTGGELIVPPLYKIFSRDPLSKETLKEMFDLSSNENTKTISMSWLAYPHYVTPETFTLFKLDEGVFYVNSIERCASAMEMSAIGGRNAALLARKHLLKSIGLNDDSKQ